MLSQELKDWIESRPLRIKEVAQKLITSDNSCLRSTKYKNNHYRLYSIGETKKIPFKIVVSLVHGNDSFLPGFRVFGVDPEDLIVCNCGKWSLSKLEETKR